MNEFISIYTYIYKALTKYDYINAYIYCYIYAYIYKTLTKYDYINAYIYCYIYINMYMLS